MYAYECKLIRVHSPHTLRPSSFPRFLFAPCYVQVILRYELQQGMVLNPRTKNVSHMKENLDIFGFVLADADVATLKALTAPAGKQPNICPDPTKIP